MVTLHKTNAPLNINKTNRDQTGKFWQCSIHLFYQKIFINKMMTTNQHSSCTPTSVNYNRRKESLQMQFRHGIKLEMHFIATQQECSQRLWHPCRQAPQFLNFSPSRFLNFRALQKASSGFTLQLPNRRHPALGHSTGLQLP